MATTGKEDGAKHDIYKMADKDGQFRRQVSQFRDHVSADPNAKFPAEKGRYVLYVNRGCPWAHRTRIVHKLKGLEDVIQVVHMGHILTPEGWIYDGSGGTDPKDPLYGFTKYRELYFKADPNYPARFTVPVIWDKKNETIVSNESSEIVRFLYNAFDAFIDPSLRDDAKPLFPENQRDEMEVFNEWTYNKISNGFYKTGFASTQEAYDENVHKLFAALDRLEEHLTKKGTPFLFGDHVSDADIRLFPGIARMDAAYFTIFKCNLKMVRHDYPRIHDWLRRLYWDNGKETNNGAFGSTTHWDAIKEGYTHAVKSAVIPAGPKEPILPL